MATASAGPAPLNRRQIARRFVLPTLRDNKGSAAGLVGLSLLLSVVPALKTELESSVINGINAILTKEIDGDSFGDALDAPVQSVSTDQDGIEGFVLGIASTIFDNARLGETAASYAILTVVAALLAWLSFALRARLERSFFTTLRRGAMDALMDPSAAALPLQERDERGITVQQGAVNIAAAYTGVLQAVQYLFALGVTVALLLDRDAWLAGAIVAVVVLQSALTYVKSRHLRGARHDLEEKRDEVVRKSDDIVQNRDFIAAHEQRGDFRDKLHALAASYGLVEQGLAQRDQGYRQFAGVVADAGRLAILFLAVAITMGVFGTRTEEEIVSVGDAYFLIAIYVRMLVPTQGMLGIWDGYTRQRDVSRRFRALLAASDQLSRPSGGEEAEGAGDASLAARLEDVHYAYPTKEGPKGALRGCSLSVPRGKTTLIVGRSGSGKTTIARLLLGFLHPQHGTVAVLGEDVRAWSHPKLLRKMSYLAQGDYVVEDSVRVNLFSKKDDDELWGVLGRVGLRDTGLDEVATRLSTGEKQRVGLARLLLDRDEIVLMDEPLSGVDAFTLLDLAPELDRYFRDGRTFVVISHRLMFTSYADHVVVLEDGVVREEGSPAELMDRGGSFASLVRAARTELGA